MRNWARGAVIEGLIYFYLSTSYFPLQADFLRHNRRHHNSQSQWNGSIVQ